jgi:hypothetical protein
MEFERQELAMETLGMSLAEGKAVLKGVQEFVAEQQATKFLQGERTCRHCARHLSSKGAGSTSVRTVFGTVRLPSPRWNQCDCQSTGRKGTFRPLQGWLCGQTSPELLYLEVRAGFADSLRGRGSTAGGCAAGSLYTKLDDDAKPQLESPMSVQELNGCLQKSWGER